MKKLKTEDTCKCKLEICMQSTLSENSLVCLKCNLPISHVVEQIAIQTKEWESIFNPIFNLWLDSGAYEHWAKKELENPSSAVNLIGLKAVKEINESVSCYYWWFQDAQGEDFQPLTHCPKCNQKLSSKYDKLVCNSCLIAIAN